MAGKSQKERRGVWVTNIKGIMLTPTNESSFREKGNEVDRELSLGERTRVWSPEGERERNAEWMGGRDGWLKGPDKESSNKKNKERERLTNRILNTWQNTVGDKIREGISE